METVAAADGYTTTLPTTIVKKEKHKKLSIDDYLGYIDDPTFDLTADQFRQILSMHGWTKSQAQKNVLVDMVETMELMDLHRSTLLDGVVSGDAEITLEEAINDFKNLDWEECHVSSLLTKRLVAPASDTVAAAAAAAAEGRPISAKRKTPITFGRKKKKAEVAIHDSAVSGGTTVAAGGTTVSTKRKARITFGKKKKAEVAVDDSPVSAGTTAAAGGTTASAKRKAYTFGKKKAVNGSAVSTDTTVVAGGTTVSAEGKTPKTLEKVRVSDSPFTGGTAVAAGGTTFTLRRKRPKTLENEKATEVPVDDSAVAAGTNAAAGSTADGLGGTVPVKRNRSERSGEKAIEVGGVSYSAIPAVLLLMRTVPPKRERNEDD